MNVLITKHIQSFYIKITLACEHFICVYMHNILQSVFANNSAAKINLKAKQPDVSSLRGD